MTGKLLNKERVHELIELYLDGDGLLLNSDEDIYSNLSWLCLREILYDYEDYILSERENVRRSQ